MSRSDRTSTSGGRDSPYMLGPPKRCDPVGDVDSRLECAKVLASDSPSCYQAELSRMKDRSRQGGQKFGPCLPADGVCELVIEGFNRLSCTQPSNT